MVRRTNVQILVVGKAPEGKAFDDGYHAFCVNKCKKKNKAVHGESVSIGARENVYNRLISRDRTGRTQS